jgi:hypothetical protein
MRNHAETGESRIVNDEATGKPYPFCHRDPSRVLEEDDLCVIYKDGFLMTLHSREIILPSDRKFWPARENLAWHRSEVFERG